jgi:hypothetical protein
VTGVATSAGVRVMDWAARVAAATAGARVMVAAATGSAERAERVVGGVAGAAVAAVAMAAVERVFRCGRRRCASKLIRGRTVCRTGR